MIIIASTVLVALLSLGLAQKNVPIYQATAAVKFEQSTQMSGLLVEVLSYSSADSIETQVSLIKSYPVLESVAKRLGRLPDMGAGGGPRDTKSYWAALDAISSKLRVTRVPSTSILEITAISPNPREARDLANATAEAYRELNKSLRNSRVTEARRFIETQLKDVESRARRTEAEIWAFREANRIIAPGAESTVLLAVSVVKLYDAVVAMTNGGPGDATDVPTKFIMDNLFERQNIGLASAASATMLVTVVIIVAPLLYARSRANAAAGRT
jgi:uncharacterized protein involved in exopolysaccharide biosynthesis